MDTTSSNTPGGHNTTPTRRIRKFQPSASVPRSSAISRTLLSPTPEFEGDVQARYPCWASQELAEKSLASTASDIGSDTGLRREGMYFGILHLGEKFASGGALILAGLLLSFFVRLAPAASPQAPVAAAYIQIEPQLAARNSGPPCGALQGGFSQVERGRP